MERILFATTPAGGANGSGTFTIIYIIFIVALFWLLLIRPQRKQRKEREAMMESLSVGDEIYTAGGILGTLTRIKDRTVWLRVSEKCEIELLKSSIGGKYTYQEIPDSQMSEPKAEDKLDSKE